MNDPTHLSKLLVRARVSEFEAVPHFLVIMEGEEMQGQSWTVQCEILPGNLLGGLPADEDPAPGPDDIPPNCPFDLFGFGQHGPGPAPQQQEVQNDQDIQGDA